MKLFLRFAALAGLCLIPQLAPAQNADDEIKAAHARMKERIKSVDQLKLNLLAGENNKGLLAAKGELDDKQKAILTAENKDRKFIYEAFAKKFDVPVPQVALSRAAKIRKIAKAGSWVQEKNGDWIKKN